MSIASPEGTDPLAECFRGPPDRVTEPCLTYMARVMELRDFISFYFNFVETSKELGKLIPEPKRNSADSKALAVLEYNYSTHRPFVNQVMLSRAVESFDLYLTTVLRDIFLSKPQLLKSEGVVEIAAVIEAESYDNLIWQLVERKVHELSYKSLSDLRKFIQSRTGIDFFPSDEAFNMTLLASEIRNLIAHNDCVANDIFKSKIKSTGISPELSSTGRVKISDEWIRRASYTLDGLVFRFDELAAKKFEIRTLNRMTSFILRE
jgi:hypothetical protein